MPLVPPLPPCRAGTGVRDYIHVVDLAKGHLAALKKIAESPGCATYNLGTGVGYSVLDMLSAFSKACGKELVSARNGLGHSEVAEVAGTQRGGPGGPPSYTLSSRSHVRPCYPSCVGSRTSWPTGGPATSLWSTAPPIRPRRSWGGVRRSGWRRCVRTRGVGSVPTRKASRLPPPSAKLSLSLSRPPPTARAPNRPTAPTFARRVGLAADCCRLLRDCCGLERARTHVGWAAGGHVQSAVEPEASLGRVVSLLCHMHPRGAVPDALAQARAVGRGHVHPDYCPPWRTPWGGGRRARGSDTLSLTAPIVRRAEG